jgi:hypothetical protein
LPRPGVSPPRQSAEQQAPSFCSFFRPFQGLLRVILLFMARSEPDDHWWPVGDLGARVDITVVPGPRGPTLRERVGPVRNRAAIGCLAAAMLAAGAVLAGVSLSGRGGATRLLPTTALPTTVLPNTVLYPTYLRPTGPAAATPATAATPTAAATSAAAFPLRCLKLLIALHDPSLRNGAFDQNLPCGRPRGPNTLIAIRDRRTGSPRPAARTQGRAEGHHLER